jgi:hypothetical protein
VGQEETPGLRGLHQHLAHLAEPAHAFGDLSFAVDLKTWRSFRFSARIIGCSRNSSMPATRAVEFRSVAYRRSVQF